MLKKLINWWKGRDNYSVKVSTAEGSLGSYAWYPNKGILKAYYPMFTVEASSTKAVDAVFKDIRDEFKEAMKEAKKK